MSILLQTVVVPEGAEAVQAIIEAAQGGHWSLFVSLVIMLLVFVATKTPLLKNFVKGEARIWTAAVAGVLSAVATSMYVSFVQDGSVDWVPSVLSGLSTGLAAGGLWSLIGRKIMKQPIDADGDGELDTLDE